MKKQNRIKRADKPRKKYWCNCDRAIVEQRKKCPICKQRQRQ